MWKLFSAILLLWASTSEGFYFRTELDWEAELKAQTEITDKCLQYSKDLDCRFYDCLHGRFPCGGPKKKNRPRAHCVRSKEKAHKLTDVGKIWINSIIKCFMKEVTLIYKRPSLDCNDVDTLILGTQHKCYTANDFCNVGWEHRRELWKIFSVPMSTSKSHYYKMMWKNIGKMSSKCNTPTAEELLKWVNAHFTDARKNLH